MLFLQIAGKIIRLELENASRLVLSVSLATPHTKSSYSPQLWRYFAIFCDSGLPFLHSEAATRSPSWSRNQMVPFPPWNTPTACRTELSPWPWLVKHHVIWCSPTSLTSAPSTLLKGSWSHKTPLCPWVSRPFLHHGLFTCSPFFTGSPSPINSHIPLLHMGGGMSLLQEATLMKGFLSHWNFTDHSVYQLFPHPQIVPQSYCLILYTTAIQIQN